MFLERETLNPNKKNCLSKPYIVGPFPLFIKGEWDFSKIAVMEGNKNFLLEFGGKPGMVRGRGYGKFLKSLCIVCRRVLTPYFMNTPTLYYLPPFLKFCPIPPFPHFPVTSNPQLTLLSVVLFLWMNGYLCHIWCAILLNDNMHLHMLSLGT